ncbi:hypothetical protein L0337_01120 [candidate division KSB1 bacterium]|nr:hypothetical protein [candidate division KSB1 bacterium]
MNGLWPKDIGEQLQVIAPVSILRRHASLLGSKTNNLVEAKVVDFERELGDLYEFNYGFYITAPTLNRYSYKLFTISHNIDLYPVIIDVDAELKREIDPENEIYKKIEANSEDEMLQVLKKIFNSHKTKKIIGSLLTIINSRQKETVTTSEENYNKEDLRF